jgi:hypothetical protein
LFCYLNAIPSINKSENLRYLFRTFFLIKVNLTLTNVHCLCYSTHFLLENARHVSNQFMVHLQGLTFLKLHHECITDVI